MSDSISPAFLIAVLILALILLGFGLLLALGPLKPRTVERFEARQALRVTPTNAAHVGAALAITHRWRRIGLVTGLALGMLWSLREASLTINFLAGFLGWFAGAVVAQWRLGALPQPGERRAATLEARTTHSYVTTTNLVLVGLAVLATAALGVAALIRAGFSLDWLSWAAYSVLVLGGLALTARVIVKRPSGFIDPDIREADDALRGHGLTVLAGSAIASLYPPLWALATLVAYPAGVPTSTDPSWVLLILVACVVLGWYVAALSPSVRALAKSRGRVGASA